MDNPIQRFEQRFHAPTTAMHMPQYVKAVKGLAQWKQAGQDQPDYWLRVEIATGFQRLVCLGITDKYPGAEMLPATAELWLLLMADMNLDEAIDRPRIRQAFKLLYTHLKQWPQLESLIANLPPRPQKAAAPPPRTAEQHAYGAARLKDILDNLGKEETENHE